MDGDLAPLREIVEMKEKYQAWLMVDEAHATGLYGSNGAGAAVEAGLQDHIEVHLGTLGKALGASGGYVCGSRKLVDFLINRARSFIFSTAPMPAAAAAARAAIDVARSSEGNKLREILWQRGAELRSSMSALNLKLMPGRSAILPVIVGEEAAAMDRAKALFARDIFVPAIRYPSVPRGQARLRFTVSAGHTQNDVQVLADALAETQALSSRA
jgi:7-keto-8-aminopelargonate synthetase-like enzyme